MDLSLARKSRCPRGGGPGKSRPRSEGWKIPVAKTCGSLKRTRGLTGREIQAFRASPSPWGLRDPRSLEDGEKERQV